MSLNTGLVRRERHESSGDASLLVLVDSGGPYWERAIVEETILSALTHFGMPFRLLDLARERPSADILNRCAGILLAQNRLASRLTVPESATIADAVRNGVGTVSFDYDLRGCGDPLLEIFGFDRINPHPYATNLLRITESGHDITSMQAPGEFHAFDRMVTAVQVDSWREEVVPLAEGILGRDQLVYIRHLAPWSAFEPRNCPLLFATRWGKGKAVQFTLNPRVWRNAFFGHARGMDDLFARAILWAVRKPFVANMVPPFVTLSMDDCSGRHDFGYVDAARAHGYRMMPSLLLKNVPERLFPKIREGLRSGQAHYSAHALDYYRLLVYNFGHGECPRNQLQSHFGFMDEWWSRIGARPGRTLRLHWGEYGVDALPFLKERGHTFFCPALQTGLHKADQCMQDGYWPYNLQTCYYDFLPDDHDFFAFAAMLTRGQEDFLTGCTAYLRESDRNDVEKAARNAARCIQHGLRGGFYAELVTHEQKFDVLSVGEWGQILRRADELTRGFEKIQASHDEIGAYLQGKDGVWIAETRVDGDRVRCVLGGGTATPLRLSVFRDDGDAVRREYETIEAFHGRAELG